LDPNSFLLARTLQSTKELNIIWKFLKLIKSYIFAFVEFYLVNLVPDFTSNSDFLVRVILHDELVVALVICILVLDPLQSH